MSSAEALRPWIEQQLGAPVAALERIGAGASRGTWRVEVAGAQALVLRLETGDGPLSGTELSLAREASVYRALGDTEVRIPRLVACHPAGDALLVEQVAGSPDFPTLAEPERSRVALDYWGCLATLHALDPAKLELGDVVADRAPVGADIELWRRICAELDVVPPVLDLAFRWLAAEAREPERAALCHGDAGPGNFLFAEGCVTALLDWEFAHVGDPLDDVAWIAVRAQLLGGFGDLRAGLAAWRDATGRCLDCGRLESFRALVLLRMAVSCVRPLARLQSGESGMDPTVYRLLLPYLLWLLPQALERAGCTDASLPELAAAGEAALDAVPVVRERAQPLAALDLP